MILQQKGFDVSISVCDVDLLWRSSMVSRLSFCCWSDRSLKSDSMRLSTVMSGWKAVTFFRQLGQLSSPPGARLCHLSMQYWQNLWPHSRAMVWRKEKPDQHMLVSFSCKSSEPCLWFDWFVSLLFTLMKTSLQTEQVSSSLSLVNWSFLARLTAAEVGESSPCGI